MRRRTDYWLTLNCRRFLLCVEIFISDGYAHHDNDYFQGANRQLIVHPNISTVDFHQFQFVTDTYFLFLRDFHCDQLMNE